MSRRALVLGVLALCACASDPVPTAEPPADQRSACSALVSSLPSQLEGDEDTGRTEFAAAWGDPRMVLKCGVEIPAEYEKTSEMIVVDDVAWFGQEQTNGYTFTAVGRTPLVSVYVPDRHQPEVNPLVDLAPPMQEHTEVTGA
ncbi:MAG: DUF3515 domain-containing protein, partial [Candidatus Nanopelagicales bacterium]|nr:DUF3515 domain-containing protein [Candidatus Nanopelagicales bacterium]